MKIMKNINQLETMNNFNLNFAFADNLASVAQALTTKKNLPMPNDILGELVGLVLAERELKEDFTLAPLTNQKGWDLKGSKGTKVEVKQTEGRVWVTPTPKPIISISAKNKEDSDYFIILDFHANRAALIPTKIVREQAFKSFKNEKDLQFRWDMRYGETDTYSEYTLKGNYKENTEVFLKYEIQL